MLKALDSFVFPNLNENASSLVVDLWVFFKQNNTVFKQPFNLKKDLPETIS